MTSPSIEIPHHQCIASLQHCTVVDTPCFSTTPDTPPGPPADVDIPVHLDESCLTEKDREQVQQMLTKWKDVFAFTSTELGCAKCVKHKIVLTDSVPFKARPCTIPPAI